MAFNSTQFRKDLLVISLLTLYLFFYILTPITKLIFTEIPVDIDNICPNSDLDFGLDCLLLSNENFNFLRYFVGNIVIIIQAYLFLPTFAILTFKFYPISLLDYIVFFATLILFSSSIVFLFLIHVIPYIFMLYTGFNVFQNELYHKPIKIIALSVLIEIYKHYYKSLNYILFPFIYIFDPNNLLLHIIDNFIQLFAICFFYSYSKKFKKHIGEFIAQTKKD